MTTPTRSVARVWLAQATSAPTPAAADRTKYYYAVEQDRVYRFAWPSDRDLWVAQGQGTRRIVRAPDALVRTAKEAAEAGEYEWPAPEWKKQS